MAAPTWHRPTPPDIVALFKALYTDTVICVRADGSESEWFPVFSGVRQGCVVAPDAFLVPMDWLLEPELDQLL